MRMGIRGRQVQEPTLHGRGTRSKRQAANGRLPRANGTHRVVVVAPTRDGRERPKCRRGWHAACRSRRADTDGCVHHAGDRPCIAGFGR